MHCKPAAIRGCTRYVGLIEVLDLLHSESLELFNLLLSYCEIVPEPGSHLVTPQVAHVLSDSFDGVQTIVICTACAFAVQLNMGMFAPKFDQHAPPSLNLLPVPIRLIQQAVALLQLGSNERLAMSPKVLCLQVCQQSCTAVQKRFNALLQRHRIVCTYNSNTGQ